MSTHNWTTQQMFCYFSKWSSHEQTTTPHRKTMITKEWSKVNKTIIIGLSQELMIILTSHLISGIWIQWNGMDSVEWCNGLKWCNGMDWNGGMDPFSK